MNKETELYGQLLEESIGQMSERLNRFTDEQWIWHPSAPVPSAQMLATNALEWMFCDRQHILEPDAKFHPAVPRTSSDRKEVIAALQAELAEWKRLLSQIRVEDLDAPRRQFNRLDADRQDVRWMMLHALGNVASCHGQLTTLSRALGHDGAQAYENVLPAAGYERLRPRLD
jgi:hypothetical protein